MPGVFARMTQFDDPRLRNNPMSLILRQNATTPSLVEVREPYSSWSDGDRCVLANPEAHLESSKRKANPAHRVKEQVITEEELLRYASTGEIPPMLGVSSLHPEPLKVVLDLSGELPKHSGLWARTVGNLIWAHRQFKIELHAVLADNMDDDSCDRLGMNSHRKGDMQLRKLNVNEDPFKARGFVEIELRRGLLVRENLYPLTKMPFEFRKEAYLANRTEIMKFKQQRNDTHANWNTKTKWAREYQIEMEGIGVPKINYEKRTMKVTGSTDKARGVAHAASDKGLQLPQIVWQTKSSKEKWRPAPTDVWLMSAKTFKSYDTLPCKKVIVLGDPKRIVDDPSVEIVTSKIEVENAHFLLQFLPLWWKLPRHEYVSSATMPRLEKRIKEFLKDLPAEEHDRKRLHLTDGVKAVLNGGPYLAKFCKACGWSDCE